MFSPSLDQRIDITRIDMAPLSVDPFKLSDSPPALTPDSYPRITSIGNINVSIDGRHRDR